MSYTQAIHRYKDLLHMITQFEWNCAYTDNSRSLDFPRLKKKFQHDPVAYAVYCASLSIPHKAATPYERAVVDLYTGSHTQPPDGLWLDPTLWPVSFPHRLKNKKQPTEKWEILLNMVEQQSQAHTSLRPILLSHDLAQSYRKGGPDSLYASGFLEIPSERDWSYWIDRGYHQTFAKILSQHPKKDTQKLRDLLVYAIQKGSFPIMQSLIETLGPRFQLDPHYLELAVRSGDRAITQYFLDQGLIPAKHDLLGALDRGDEMMTNLLLQYTSPSERGLLYPDFLLQGSESSLNFFTSSSPEARSRLR